LHGFQHHQHRGAPHHAINDHASYYGNRHPSYYNPYYPTPHHQISNNFQINQSADLKPINQKVYSLLPLSEAKNDPKVVNFQMKYPSTYFDKKKSGGKKRKASEMSQAPPSGQELAAIKSGLKTEFGAEVSPNIKTRVYIFDLNDVLIPDIKVFGHARILAFNEAEKMRARAQQLWSMDMITYIGQTFFFKDDLEHYDQSNVEDASSDDNGQDLSMYNFSQDGFVPHDMGYHHHVRGSVDWMRKMAFRYRHIRDTYNNFKGRQGERDGVLTAKRTLEKNNQKMTGPSKTWLKMSANLLDILVSKPGAKIVICTNSKLVEAVSKLVVFGLDRYVDIADVYSSHKVGKSSLYDRIKGKYGNKNTSYVVIGSGDTRQHARASNISMFEVNKMSHLSLAKQCLESDCL